MTMFGAACRPFLIGVARVRTEGAIEFQ